MTISAFEERRTLKWGDFLLETEERFNGLNSFNKKYRTSQDKKSEKEFINGLIKKGQAYQDQLNENWIENGFMPYEHYRKQMNRYINLQNIIIDEIDGFITNCYSYYNERQL